MSSDLIQNRSSCLCKERLTDESPKQAHTNKTQLLNEKNPKMPERQEQVKDIINKSVATAAPTQKNKKHKMTVSVPAKLFQHELLTHCPERCGVFQTWQHTAAILVLHKGLHA